MTDYDKWNKLADQINDQDDPEEAWERELDECDRKIRATTYLVDTLKKHLREDEDLDEKRTKDLKEQIEKEEKKLEDLTSNRPEIVDRQPLKEVFSVTKKGVPIIKDSAGTDLENMREDLSRTWERLLIVVVAACCLLLMWYYIYRQRKASTLLPHSEL